MLDTERRDSSENATEPSEEARAVEGSYEAVLHAMESRKDAEVSRAMEAWKDAQIAGRGGSSSSTAMTGADQSKHNSNQRLGINYVTMS